MMVQQRPGAYRRTATLWLRVVAILMLGYAIGAFFYASVVPASQSRTFWTSGYYLVIGALLGALSTPLGRLAAIGLDESENS